MLKRLGDLLMGTGRKKSSLDGLNLAQELKSLRGELMETKLDLARLAEILLVIMTGFEEDSRKPQKHGTLSKSNVSTKKPLKNSKSSKAKTKKQP